MSTMTTNARRPGVQHREVAREAGYGRFSWLSTLAGILCLFGTAALATFVAAAALSRTDVELTTDDLTSSGFAATLVAAAILFVAALFGGYVAGRMARRSGVLHGVAVVVGTFLFGAVLSGIGAGAQGLDLRDDLGDIGVPTTWDAVQDVAVVGGLVALAAIVVGAVLGGLLGERWHTKLARRVDDPSYGPAAEERERIEAEARRRREEDRIVRADADEERMRRTPADDDRILARDDRTVTDHERITARDDQRTDRPLPGSEPEVVDLRDRPVAPADPSAAYVDEHSPTTGHRR